MTHILSDVAVHVLVVAVFYVCGVVMCNTTERTNDMLIGMIVGISAHGIANIINIVRKN